MSKKITQNINNVTENEKKQYIFGTDESRAVITVWCDGRQYDPESEGYRPIYTYQITTSQWSYTANDIVGALNEVPDLYAASQSLFAFLFMCCVEDAPESDKQMFPDYVRVWGEEFVREFRVLSQEAAKVVQAATHDVVEPEALPEEPPEEPEEEMSAEDIFGEDD